jgi:transitional endoplasmic reticulum ATPase
MDSVRPTITEEILEYYEGVEDEFTGGTAEPGRGRRESRIGFQ